MRRAVVVVALIAACRGDSTAPARDRNAGSHPGSASSVADVPRLPRSEDGTLAMRALDGDIERAARKPLELVPLLLERASIAGLVEDYQRALDVARATVEAMPASTDALAMLVGVELAVHAFGDARAHLATLASRVPPATLAPLQLELDHATGHLEAALVGRKARVDVFADARSVTLYAATLAEAGRYDEAIALIPAATAQLRGNTPGYLAWLLFQWGRLYEGKGELSRARDFYAEAHRRLPAHVEAAVHLAETLEATGDRAGARAVVDRVADRHPALLAVAARLSGDPALVQAATAAWERYVAALPAAFADHAARFYLTAGTHPARALELARGNLAARETPAARALVIEAALAAGEPGRACESIGPLATNGPRRERFVAWRALAACGRTDDANRLARELGIPPN